MSDYRSRAPTVLAFLHEFKARKNRAVAVVPAAGARRSVPARNRESALKEASSMWELAAKRMQAADKFADINFRGGGKPPTIFAIS